MKRFIPWSAAALAAATLYAAAPLAPQPPQVREIVRLHAHPEAVEKPEAVPAGAKPAKDFGKLHDRELPNIFYLPKPEVSDEAQ
ncbi:hypothetical protein WCX72_07745 [Sulfurimonas sp. HSL1-6]|uniref:hypothetical protein n=1 Tax=Thiomicrolovo immobilis TaxID=3131935 RepID=UPI0031F7C650